MSLTLECFVSLRMTFGVDPDTHIDTVEQAKASTIEGTSKWSCKLSITGIDSNSLASLNLKHPKNNLYQICVINFHIKSQLITLK
jgi:hypothetical protein